MARAALDTKLVPPTGRRMTYEEFLDWADEGTHAEWVAGQVTVFMPPSLAHQLIVGFLHHLLGLFVSTFNLGVVLMAPFQMKLVFRPSGREPDLIFVADEHRARLTDVLLDGPADLAVEVVSKDSRRRDRRDKFLEYATAGIREYWLVDPDSRRAEFYGLDPHGRYVALPVGPDGVFRSSVVPGFWLRVDWLWQQPPPDLAALRDLGLLQTLDSRSAAAQQDALP